MNTSPGHHRHGIVFVDEDRECDELDTYHSLRRFAEDSDDSDYAEPDSVSEESESDSFHSEGEEIAEYWDPYLYRLQLQAPKPNHIPCQNELPDRPTIYGEEYHGSITRDETARLLGSQDGNYLVRRGLSHAGSYSLSFVFGGQVRHYRLYYHGHDHYVGEKPFETIEDLVQDGLITLYMEANNVEDYLQSARETRSIHRPSDAGHLGTIPEGHHSPSDEAVYSGESSEGITPPHTPAKTSCLPRSAKPIYQPCTIQQKRDSIHHSESGASRARLSRIYEEIEDDGRVAPVMNGFIKDDGRVAPVMNGFIKDDGRVAPVMNGFIKTSHDTKAADRTRKESSLYFHYEKSHSFQLHNYIGLSWCDYCRNFMWGLRNQGYRCKDCGYNAHKQCKDDVASDCQPSRQLVKRVYGVELTTLVKMQGTKVPIVVRDCIEEIEKRGLANEGLYRVSGKANDILRIKKQFDNDMCSDLTTFLDVHAITGALKLYLRELPIPVMTFDAYDIFLIAARSNSVAESLQMLRVGLTRLPPAHYNTLRHILRHLHMIQKLKDVNKMDCKNLAVVFTPTVMRSPYNNTGMMAMKKLPEEKAAMEMFIQHYQSLFQ